MDMGSKSDRAFTDDDDDEEDYGKRDGSARRDSTVKMDGQSDGGLKPISPRSKHSATEQRRRSKINDRFQILRDLIPQRDQKRDKASFLLEAIEHIQYLHEKVQKYDSSFPEWSNAKSKMMPWKVTQVPPKVVGEPAHLTQNGLSPAFLISGDNAISAAATILTNCQASLELENVSSGVENKDAFSGLLQQYNNDGGYAQSQPTVISNSENVTSQSHGYMLNGQDMAVDDGTISISCPYSHGLLQALSQTLQDCSVDLSEANISVQINLGKRALCRSVSSHKDQAADSAANHVIGFSQMDHNAEESDHANKRLKTDSN